MMRPVLRPATFHTPQAPWARPGAVSGRVRNDQSLSPNRRTSPSTQVQASTTTGRGSVEPDPNPVSTEQDPGEDDSGEGDSLANMLGILQLLEAHLTDETFLVILWHILWTKAISLVVCDQCSYLSELPSRRVFPRTQMQILWTSQRSEFLHSNNDYMIRLIVHIQTSSTVGCIHQSSLLCSAAPWHHPQQRPQLYYWSCKAGMCSSIPHSLQWLMFALVEQGQEFCSSGWRQWHQELHPYLGPVWTCYSAKAAADSSYYTD